ncbi:MobA-like NTP transferase domain-containing protein [Aspergillus unguis]
MLPLLLAGGRSSRMGTRKELLAVTHIPLYEHQLVRLHRVTESETVYLSLPDPSCLGPILDNPHIEPLGPETLRLHHQTRSFSIHLLYDRDSAEPPNADDNGPAAGLAAAYKMEPRATWLVAACDYPFLSVSALAQLRDQQAGAVTCFENTHGIYEPLLGVWTPPALALLCENVKNGILGPKFVVVKTNGTTIRPKDEVWLFNMNTPEEYEQARKMKQEIGTIMDDYYA